MTFDGEPIASMAYEMLADTAWARFYIKADHIETQDHIATLPAFLLFREGHGKWDVWLETIVKWRFTSEKAALDAIREKFAHYKTEGVLLKNRKQVFATAKGTIPSMVLKEKPE
jgi:hypothetical protein